MYKIVNLINSEIRQIKAEELNSDRLSIIMDIEDPELWIFKPEKSIAKDSTIVICGGGGFGKISFWNEGIAFAQWLASLGYMACVLKYRLPKGNPDLPIGDLEKAVEYLHENTITCKTHKIGVAGFSAGGMLAALISNNFGNKDNAVRPDFTILCYPVTTTGKLTHAGSITNLLGKNPTQEQLAAFSPENLVTEQTPPTILFVSEDDMLVNMGNSKIYNSKLEEKGVPSMLTIYKTGGHAWGMNPGFRYHQDFLDTLEAWLERYAQICL